MQVVDLPAASDKILLHLSSWQFYYPIRERRGPIPRRVVGGTDVLATLARSNRKVHSDAYKKLVASCLLRYLGMDVRSLDRNETLASLLRQT